MKVVIICENCGFIEELPESSPISRNPEKFECPNCGKIELVVK